MPSRTIKKKYPELVEEYGCEDIYFQDELRVGLRTELKRVWCGPKHQPLGKMKISYQYFYLYLALNPFSGHLFALFLPNMKRVTFELFLEHFQKEYHWNCPERREDDVVMILDRAGAHCSSKLSIPKGVVLEYLPPYCPELNPAERFFEELRRELANEIFETLEDLEEALTGLLEYYWEHPESVRRLTLFTWLNPLSNYN